MNEQDALRRKVMETKERITEPFILYGPGTPEWDTLARVYHFTPTHLAGMLEDYSASVRKIGLLLGVNDNGVFAADGENWDWSPGDDVVFIPWKQAQEIMGRTYQ